MFAELAVFKPVHFSPRKLVGDLQDLGRGEDPLTWRFAWTVRYHPRPPRGVDASSGCTRDGSWRPSRPSRADTPGPWPPGARGPNRDLDRPCPHGDAASPLPYLKPFGGCCHPPIGKLAKTRAYHPGPLQVPSRHKQTGPNPHAVIQPCNPEVSSSPGPTLPSWPLDLSPRR